MIDKNVVKAQLFNRIKNECPDYVFDDLTTKTYDFIFDLGPIAFSEDEAEDIFNSFVSKIRTKTLDGKITSWEELLWKNTEKIVEHKGNSGKGQFEDYAMLIMNWKLSDSKGCDLVDPKTGIVYDVKATKDWNHKKKIEIPCTFYVGNEPIINKRKNIWYGGKCWWTVNDFYNFKGMYQLISKITHCKIEYPDLDKYIVSYHDEISNTITTTTKDKDYVERVLNNFLSYKPIDTSRICFTGSWIWNGAVAFTAEEFFNL